VEWCVDVADIRTLSSSLTESSTINSVTDAEGETSLPMRHPPKTPAANTTTQPVVLGTGKGPEQSNCAHVSAIKIRIAVIEARAESEDLRSSLEGTISGIEGKHIADVVQIVCISVATLHLDLADRRGFEAAFYFKLQCLVV